MKVSATLCFVIVFHLVTVGQVNLVLNPSFEDTMRCPSDSTVTKAKVWFTPNTHSPDYFYPTMTGNYSCQDQYPQLWGGGGYTIWNNNWGAQLPRTGLAYAGMGVTLGGELMAGKLSDSLRSGKKYAISFYASLGEAAYSQGGQGLDLINLCFMQDSVTDYSVNDWMYLGTLNVDAGNQSENFLNDTTGWMLVLDTFVAEGGERFFVLGNIDTANTQYVNSQSPTFCYYYFDDFDVHCIDCTSDTSEPPAYLEITVAPTLTSGEIVLDGNFPEGTQFEIYNTLGQRVYYTELQSGNQSQRLFLALADGSYIYRVQSGGANLKTGKLVLTH